LEIAHQARRAAPASSLGGGIIDGEAGVVEQPDGAQSIQGGIDGLGRVLFLQQPAAQVEARMRPACERALRGAMGGLEIGQLLQPREDERANLLSDDEVQT